jgi:long-chain acyl-CoA synthetase
LAQLLLRTARVFPDRPAVLHGTRTLFGYGELALRVATLAGHLRGRFALQAGDRVAIFMHNAPAYLEVLYAIWHAGLVAVPVNAKLHPRELSYVLDDSGARLLFVDAMATAGDASCAIVDVDALHYASLLQGAAVDPCPTDGANLAWLFYTSGTTGRPKGVMLSHANLLAMTLCYFSDVDAATADDAVLYAAPMSHGAGMLNFAHTLVGARHLIPESGGFAPDEILALAHRHRNVAMFAAPTMVRRLVDRCAATGTAPDGIKTIVYGGGPMYLEDIRRALDVMGDRFVQIYGQGESPMTITALSRRLLADRDHPRYLQRIASVGVAQSVVEVQVADGQGRTLACGEVGEVMVRGATVMRGYWNNPEATRQALPDGWLRTGDVGELDGDGFLTLKDRSKDVIISGGTNIYPREVEETLLMHVGVAEVSVIGRPNPEWGEEVVAFVVCRHTDITAAELDLFCLERIARFKRPKAYHFVTALPKNNYGKVLKTELRDLLAWQEKSSALASQHQKDQT